MYFAGMGEIGQMTDVPKKISGKTLMVEAVFLLIHCLRDRLDNEQGVDCYSMIEGLSP
jgi:hypothetical protein